MDFFHQLFDVKHGGLENLIKSLGYVFLFAIVFAETGLLVGFIFPGDSLLFIAGFVAAQGTLHIGVMIAVLILATILGDNAGFLIGSKAGPPLFSKPDGRVFKKKHLESAQKFYEKHGAKTLILARFVPIVRTFAPVVAGASGMEYRRFVFFDALGGIAWATSMSLAGYFLGNIPIVKANLEKAVIGIIFLSILPVILHAIKEKRAAKAKTGADLGASIDA